ncbi:hypothetical protein ACFYT4_34195 [Streptomyces sp. NPDC004609]|uniref:hypothetical protein n=1 Tax=Streptomyces sp. NPDC004609 TaxID=3364704 RepID=UPI0036B28FB3
MAADWTGPAWRMNLPETWMLCDFLKTDSTLRSWGACHHWGLLELQVLGVVKPVTRTEMQKKYVFFGPLEPFVSRGFVRGARSDVRLTDYMERAKDRVLTGLRQHAASQVSDQLYGQGTARGDFAAGGDFDRELIRSMAARGYLRITSDSWSGLESRRTERSESAVRQAAADIERARGQFPEWVRSDPGRALEFTRSMGAMTLMVPSVHESWRSALARLFKSAAAGRGPGGKDSGPAARVAGQVLAGAIRGAARSEQFGDLVDGFYDRVTVEVTDTLLDATDFSGVWDFSGAGDGGGDGGDGGG